MNLYVGGKLIQPGASVPDFRGDDLYYVRVAQEPSPGKSGKCYFAHRKADVKDEFKWSVYYPGVVGGEIH